MSPRQTLGAVALVGALLLTACSAESDGAPPPDSTDAPTSPPPVTEPESSATEPPVDVTVEPMSYLDVQAAREAGDVDDVTMVLSEFSVLFGVDLDGAIPIIADDDAPISGSHAMMEAQQLLPSLPADQQAIIEQAIADATSGTPVYRSVDDEEYLAAVEVGATLDDPAAGEPIGSPDSEPPTTEPQGLIRQAPALRVDESEAIRISQSIAIWLQGRLGGPALDFETVVAPASAARTGTVEATTVFNGGLLGRDCEIYVYDRARITGAYLTSVLGHEVMHCWQHMNAAADDSVLRMTPYYLEGIAMWAGEQMTGGTAFSTLHSRNFFASTDFPVFLRAYTAFNFWNRVAELRGGTEKLWEVIPALNSVADEPGAVWNAALDRVSLPDRALLASGPLRRSDWSAAWTMSGRGMTDDARWPHEVSVSPGVRTAVDVRAGEQSATTFDLTGLAPDTSWVLSIRSSTESSIAAWNLGQEFRPTVGVATDYCYGGTCECPDGLVPLPSIQFPPTAATAVTIAVTGSAFEAANAVVTATDVREFCEEEPAEDGPPPGSGDFDGNGTWRATNPSLDSMFTDASAFGFGAEPLDIAAVTGDVVMELGSDGIGTITYTDVTAIINNGPLTDLTINGEGTFQFGVEAGVLSVSGNTFTVAVSSSALFGESLEISDRDIGGAGGLSTFTVGFDGRLLVLTDADGSNGAVFFPRLWTPV